ncbi:tetratricopeptide repeat protein [Leptolyngbya ohadii]|uniref:tetratricopeptide repeat protein n=1 Tax=Leptolyngbya ohadii TaxID=1962290 RepID=UPI00117A98B1|nr:tetratricopeptide repeat protein [Leptolyngbya ohadii]
MSGRTMGIWHRMTGTLSLFMLLGAANPLLPAWADVPASGSIDCRQERDQTTEQTLFSLQERIGQDLDQQQFEQANQRMRQMIQTIALLQDIQWRSTRLQGLVNAEESGQRNLWVELINRSAEKGFAEQAKGVLAEAVQLTQSLNSGYSSLKAQALVQLARDYQTLGDRQAGLDTLALAVNASQTVQGEEFQVNVLIPIAEAYVALEEPVTAVDLMHRAKQFAEAVNPADVSRRDRVMAKVAQAYLKAGQLEAALAIVPTLTKTPNVHAEVLLSAVRFQVQQGQIDAAAELANLINNYPSVGALAQVEAARGYALQGNESQADRLFQQAIQTAQTAGDAEYTLSQVITTYGKTRPDAALPLAESLTDPEKRLAALTQIALGYASSNQSTQARQTIQKAIATVPNISSDWQGFAVQNAADLAIVANQPDLAVLLAAALTDPFANPPRDLLLERIAQKTAERGQLDAALNAVQSISASNPDARSRAILPLSKAFIQANRYSDAIQLIDLINATDTGYRAMVQAAIASDLLLSGNTDPAVALFEQAKQTAATLTDPIQQFDAWGAIAIQYSRAGQPIDAEVMQRLRETVSRFGDNSVAANYIRLTVERALPVQQYETALQIAQLIPDPTDRGYQLNSVAQESLKANQLQLVSQAIAQISAPDSKMRLLLSLIDRSLQDNQPQTAIALLEQAAQVAQTIPDPEIRVLRFGNEGGTIVDDDSDRASSYEAIALRYVKLGRQAEGLRVAGLIQDRPERDRVTQRLLCYAPSVAPS